MHISKAPTIHKYREDDDYKKLRKLLADYPQTFVDELYLTQDFDRKEELLDCLDKNGDALLSGHVVVLTT